MGHRRAARRRHGLLALVTLGAAVVGWQAADAVGARGSEGPGAPAAPSVVVGTDAALLPGPDAGGADEGTDLDPVLAERFARARAAAAAQGVALTLTSGRRSAAEQQALVDEAVARRGAVEARRWVLPPESSAHVAGRAIDVGPLEGAEWLAERSTELGLCRTYANEWWHFEPAPPDGVCPVPLPDSSSGW